MLQGIADLQGYGNGLVNVIYGNTGNNLLNGVAGADLMVGGAGNDTYFVDDTSDVAFEIAGEGNDAVFSTAHYGLAADVETLVLQGGADLQGYGNNQANTLYGNTGNNLLNGAGGADTMVGGVGNDTYFVDNGLDQVVENPSEGADVVFSTSTSPCRERGNAGAAGLRRLPTAPATRSPTASSAIPATTGSTAEAGPTRSPATPATTPSCSASGKATATPSSTSPATARRRVIRCSSSATARRDLHPDRRHALAGQLQRRRLARGHRVHERRINSSD